MYIIYNNIYNINYNMGTIIRQWHRGQIYMASYTCYISVNHSKYGDIYAWKQKHGKS